MKRPRTAHNDVGAHPRAKVGRIAEDLTIVFADIGNVATDLRKDLPVDSRDPISSKDVEDYAKEFEADVKIYPSFVEADDVQWIFQHRPPRRADIGVERIGNFDLTSIFRTPTSCFFPDIFLVISVF